MSKVERSFLKMILVTAITKKMPTPIPIEAIKRELLMTSCTCIASTDKSGSAMVINIPIIKHTGRIIDNFFVFINEEPICSPIGCIAISAPKLNNAIPKIKNITEIQKTITS